MSDSIRVTLPDGSDKTVPAGSRPIDIAQSIGPRLADDAVVARFERAHPDLRRVRNLAQRYTAALTSLAENYVGLPFETAA